MYLRIIHLKRDEKHYKYLKLVETTRHKDKIIQKTLLNFGNIEQWPEDKLNELVFQLNGFCNLKLGPKIEDVDIHDAFDFEACFAPDTICAIHDMSQRDSPAPLLPEPGLSHGAQGIPRGRYFLECQ